MAKRPVYISISEPDHLVKEVLVHFTWFPGFSSIQKKRNILALHESAKNKGFYPLLEISTKSEDVLGQRLSAFNLKIKTEIGEISVEAAYQGSKVFEIGGPYRDIYEKDSRAAKRDMRLRKSGPLKCFDYFGEKWPLVPKTAFYDWLYLSALRPHQDFLKRLYSYRGFTDIEFNPQKSVNCQARTCALLVSLLKRNVLNEALRSQRDFIDRISSDSFEKDHSVEFRQGKLAL